MESLGGRARAGQCYLCCWVCLPVVLPQVGPRLFHLLNTYVLCACYLRGAALRVCKNKVQALMELISSGEVKDSVSFSSRV